MPIAARPSTEPTDIDAPMPRSSRAEADQEKLGAVASDCEQIVGRREIRREN